ncbi:MAG: SCO family protein [Ectobacillus sp.]
MKRHLTRFIVIAAVLLLAACGNKIENPLNWKLQSFSYTDQNGDTFGLNDLKGKVWVADFVFTSCETVCPPMTANMTKLQQKLKEEGITDVEFVSFSVDPTVDTPAKLKEFMDKYDMDAAKWHFLTGYSQGEINAFASKNFKTAVNKPASSTQVIHGTSLYIVDQNGIVVKNYSAIKDTPYEQIIRDIKTLR